MKRRVRGLLATFAYEQEPAVHHFETTIVRALRQKEFGDCVDRRLLRLPSALLRRKLALLVCCGQLLVLKVRPDFIDA